MARAAGAFGPVRFPVYPPSGSDGLLSADEPIEAPVLEHVHGFHVAARPAVLFLAERLVAVAAGKLVVAIDLDTKKQTFIRGHTDAVTCLAFSVEQGFGASGQMLSAGAKCAEVLIWNPDTLQPCSFLTFHQADIEAMGFVHSGEVLITIGGDRDHTLALWSVAKDRALRVRKREKAPLVTCSAYKSGLVNGILAAPEKAGQAAQFVTFGAAHLKFWKSSRLSPSLGVSSRRAAFGDGGAPKQVVHVAWTPKGELIAGGSDGQIFFFEGTRAVRCLHQQKHAVALLVPLKLATLAVYANGLCSLLREGSEGRPVDMDLAALPGAPDSRWQSLFLGGKSWRQSSLLLASRTHLLLFDFAAGLREPRSCTTILSQPSKQVTAVCAHPSEPRCFVGSLDGGVRCFRTDTHEPVPERSFKSSSGITCLAISGATPGSAAWLAVGCEDSTLAVLGEASLKYAFRRSLAGRGERCVRLTCATFSSCDCSGAHPLWLAVGADDGSIHTFRFKDSACQFESHTGAESIVKVATLRGHGAPVVAVSFAGTLPCQFLLSVDASGQSLAFDVPMGRRLPSMSLVRDVPFSPWTLPIGWQVQGCWPRQRSVVDSKSAGLPMRCFSEVTGRSLIAASDADSPTIELYPFPCPTAPSQATPRLHGPSSPISALLHGGRSDRLLAASDALVFVWKWPSRPSWEPAQPEPSIGSPLRPVQQTGVLLDTPEGEKHALAAEDAGLLSTPQAKSPAYLRGGNSAVKENLVADSAAVSAPWAAGTPDKPASDQAIVAPPWALHWETDQASGASPKQPPAHALRGDSASAPLRPATAPLERPPLAAMPEVAPLPCNEPRSTLADRCCPVSAWAESPAKAEEPAPQASEEEAGAVIENEGAPEAKAPLPVFFLGGAIAEATSGKAVQSRLRRSNSSTDFVSPKIGTRECGAAKQVARDTQWVREDTQARARSVHQRQACDSVRMLIGGSEPSASRRRSNSVGAVASTGEQGRENPAGRFLYRARDTGSFFEIEAQLPGGRLCRVLRNPLRRTLTFEGEVSPADAPLDVEPGKEWEFEERLVVRVPPGFDLLGAPAHIERAFSEGRCLVALHKNGGEKPTERALSFGTLPGGEV